MAIHLPAVDYAQYTQMASERARRLIIVSALPAKVARQTGVFTQQMTTLLIRSIVVAFARHAAMRPMMSDHAGQ